MPNSCPVGKGIGVGTISGAIAGIVMLPFMIITNMLIGNPPLAFQTMTGMMMGQEIVTASGFGIALHMLASTIIGIIFGIVTSTDKLRLSSFAKGIAMGIATGIIAFAVLFLPMMSTVIPPQMAGLMHTMNPNMPTSMIMQNIQAAMPVIIGGSIAVHIIFGAVLGGVATAIIRKSAYECVPCHMKFKNMSEFNDHTKRHDITQKH